MTIEDPVEYVFPSINQIQINEQADITFATGLKSILRQDPDVILVGEIRDVETARIAVQSALTGHLVLSSLHATDAVAALHRFLDMGIESFLIASSVVGVVGQRLVRRICVACSRALRADRRRARLLRGVGRDAQGRLHPRRPGATSARSTGYPDRIGVYELLRVTRADQAAHRRLGDARRAARHGGLRRACARCANEALRLVEEDITTISEVLRSIYLV